MEEADAMGAALLDEELYRRLQGLGEFDLKTSSWLLTPAGMRGRGGALLATAATDASSPTTTGRTRTTERAALGPSSEFSATAQGPPPRDQRTTKPPGALAISRGLCSYCAIA